MISSEIGKEVIKKELTLIPKLPGVYRMLNEKGDILYVGKAKIYLIDLRATSQKKIILLERNECCLKQENWR